MRRPGQNDPIEVSVEVIADGEGLRVGVATPSTTQSFVLPTDLVGPVVQMLLLRQRAAAAMRAALAPEPSEPSEQSGAGTEAAAAE